MPVHIATASRHHQTSAAGNFCHLWLVSNTKSYQASKAKAEAKDHPQGQGQGLDASRSRTNIIEFKRYMTWQMMVAMLHSNGKLNTERDEDTEKGCQKPAHQTQMHAVNI